MPLDIIHLVDTTASCANALTVLAAPILLSRARQHAERSGGHLDLDPPLEDFVELVDGLSDHYKREGQGPALVRLAEAVREIRAQIASHSDPKNNVDRAIIDAARAALRAHGVPEPPAGWDRFAG
jgi:hypothetical protein